MHPDGQISAIDRGAGCRRYQDISGAITLVTPLVRLSAPRHRFDVVFWPLNPDLCRGYYRLDKYWNTLIDICFSVRQSPSSVIHMTVIRLDKHFLYLLFGSHLINFWADL